MLYYPFIFNGCVNRRRFVIEFASQFVCIIVLTVLLSTAGVLLVGVDSDAGTAKVGFATALLVGILFVWANLALVAKRWRDIGWSPWIGLGGLLLIFVGDRLLGAALPAGASLDFLARSSVGLVLYAIYYGSLLVIPTSTFSSRS
jgi:uncharacterized membrane protein YhaH (DUF805 family)